MMRRRCGRWLTLLLVGLSACSDANGPEQDIRDETELNFLRFAASAPPLVTSDTTFWAVRGEDRTLELFFQPALPGEDPEKFLDLKIPGDASLILSSGVPVADSVPIRVVVDPQRLLVSLSPSGLQFGTENPAELRLEYEEADDDLNGDGVVDAEDDAIKDLELSFWRQEGQGDPWIKIGSIHVKDLERFEANLAGFSGYAVAW